MKILSHKFDHTVIISRILSFWLFMRIREIIFCDKLDIHTVTNLCEMPHNVQV